MMQLMTFLCQQPGNCLQPFFYIIILYTTNDTNIIEMTTFLKTDINPISGYQENLADFE